jgi:hypothetical protein
MHSTTLKIVLAGLLASAALSGCAPNTPRLDANFGDAVNTAKAQQTINPDASQNTDPVAGLDGQAANAVIDRYQKSYEQPPAPTNVFTIGVGGGSTGTTR